jgi:rod shape-determining protein MreB
MSRFGRLIGKYIENSLKTLPDTAIDLGSANTRVKIAQRVAFHEPTCIAYHKQNQEVITFGQAAADLAGKVPNHITVSFPIRESRVVDTFGLEEFIKAVTQKVYAHQGNGLGLFQARMLVGMSPALTVVQQEAFKKTFQAAHFLPVLKNKMDSLITYIHAQPQWKRVMFVVDMGAMTTEIAVYSQGEYVTQKTLPIGGEHFTHQIIQSIRQEYHCEVGWGTAEKIKKEIADIHNAAERKMVVRGKDIFTSLPTTIQISAQKLNEPLVEVGNEFLENIHRVCQRITPDLLTAALENGVFLTGGGSLLKGLDMSVGQKLQSEVIKSPTPFEDIVKSL